MGYCRTSRFYSSNGGRRLCVIPSGLVELGYGVAGGIDAQYVRMANARRRVVHCRKSWQTDAPAKVVLKSEGGGGG